MESKSVIPRVTGNKGQHSLVRDEVQIWVGLGKKNSKYFHNNTETSTENENFRNRTKSKDAKHILGTPFSSHMKYSLSERDWMTDPSEPHFCSPHTPIFSPG